MRRNRFPLKKNENFKTRRPRIKKPTAEAHRAELSQRNRYPGGERNNEDVQTFLSESCVGCSISLSDRRNRQEGGGNGGRGNRVWVRQKRSGHLITQRRKTTKAGENNRAKETALKPAVESLEGALGRGGRHPVAKKKRILVPKTSAASDQKSKVHARPA